VVRNKTVKPNFFIIGAPKAGTTALYTYLSEHPRVYMSMMKEPHFFATDFPNYRARGCSTLDDYLRLFADAKPECHQAVGEASVHYIHSAEAVRNIYNFDPEAKLIAMLRHPADLIYSFHGQCFFCAIEDEADFEVAWRLQASRREGVMNLPLGCFEPALVQYEQIGKLGRQVESVLNIFPREQVLFILFDDFVADTPAVYERVLNFLEIPRDARQTFDKVNESKRPRWRWLNELIYNTPPWMTRLYKYSGVRGYGIKDHLLRLNTKRKQRSSLSPAFRTELLGVFRQDILKLSNLLKRDLGHWLS
jgi:hypothetical protein